MEDQLEKYFYYVRFMQDDEKIIVPGHCIKNLKEIKFDRIYKVKYSDNNYYKAQIITFGDTEESLKAKMQVKRLKITPLRLMHNESECSEKEGEEPEEPDRNKEGLAAGKKNKNSSKISNFERIHNLNFSSNLRQIDVQDNNNNETCKNCSNLRRKIDELEEEKNKHKSELKKLRELNLRLQETVIEKFKSLETSLETAVANAAVMTKEHVVQDPNELPVAARVDGQVHVGRGILIPAPIFDNIYSRGPKKDGQFIKDMALAVFGTKVLESSSVTGAKSNRYKTEPKPQLDPTKKLAICDILRYRLQERGASQEEINRVVATVNQKIGEKIQDIIKPNRRKNKGEVISLEEEIRVTEEMLHSEQTE